MLKNDINLADKYAYLDEKIQRGLKWLKETDLSKLEKGKYLIEGDEIFADVQSYVSFPYEECFYESHKKYVDIQYVVEGEEFFGCVDVADLAGKTPYNEQNDITFYNDPEYKVGVALKQGDFAIVYPEEAHKPRIRLTDAVFVKKIVLKIKL